MLSAVISSVHSYPAMLLAKQQVHQRYVHSGPLVLGTGPVKFPAPTADRDQTVSRRFEPSSRTSLNGEQPYPWDRLQPQDEMSRHRGAKHRRRYELLGGISLLSPEYLLSVERWPFHTEPPDHYVLLFVPARLVSLAVKRACAITPSSAISDRAERTFELLRYLLGRRPPQSNCPPCTVPTPDSGGGVRTATPSGWYFNVGSTETSVPVSKPPSYPTINIVTVPCKATVKVHGVFPSFRGRLHHHKHFNFLLSLWRETVWPSLRTFVRVGTTGQRNFATLGPL